MSLIIKINGQEIDQFPNDSIKIRKGVIDSTDITKRLGSFTYTIKLPRTNKNNKILTHYLHEQSKKRFDVDPIRTQLTGEVISNGDTIIKGDVILKDVKPFGDTFSINIINSSANIDELFSNKNIRDLTFNQSVKWAMPKVNNLKQENLTETNARHLNDYRNWNDSLIKQYHLNVTNPNSDDLLVIHHLARGRYQNKYKHFNEYSLNNGVELNPFPSDILRLGNEDRIDNDLLINNDNIKYKYGKNLFANNVVRWDGEKMFVDKNDGNGFVEINPLSYEAFNSYYVVDAVRNVNTGNVIQYFKHVYIMTSDGQEWITKNTRFEQSEYESLIDYSWNMLTVFRKIWEEVGYTTSFSNSLINNGLNELMQASINPRLPYKKMCNVKVKTNNLIELRLHLLNYRQSNKIDLLNEVNFNTTNYNLYDNSIVTTPYPVFGNPDDINYNRTKRNEYDLTQNFNNLINSGDFNFSPQTYMMLIPSFDDIVYDNFSNTELESPWDDPLGSKVSSLVNYTGTNEALVGDDEGNGILVRQSGRYNLKFSLDINNIPSFDLLIKSIPTLDIYDYAKQYLLNMLGLAIFAGNNPIKESGDKINDHLTNNPTPNNTKTSQAIATFDKDVLVYINLFGEDNYVGPLNNFGDVSTSPTIAYRNYYTNDTDRNVDINNVNNITLTQDPLYQFNNQNELRYRVNNEKIEIDISVNLEKNEIIKPVLYIDANKNNDLPIISGPITTQKNRGYELSELKLQNCIFEFEMVAESLEENFNEYIENNDFLPEIEQKEYITNFIKKNNLYFDLNESQKEVNFFSIEDFYENSNMVDINGENIKFENININEIKRAQQLYITGHKNASEFAYESNGGDNINYNDSVRTFEPIAILGEGFGDLTSDNIQIIDYYKTIDEPNLTTNRDLGFTEPNGWNGIIPYTVLKQPTAINTYERSRCWYIQDFERQVYFKQLPTFSDWEFPERLPIVWRFIPSMIMQQNRYNQTPGNSTSYDDDKVILKEFDGYHPLSFLFNDIIGRTCHLPIINMEGYSADVSSIDSDYNYKELNKPIKIFSGDKNDENSLINKLWNNPRTVNKGEQWEINCKLKTSTFRQIKNNSRIILRGNVFDILEINGFDVKGESFAKLKVLRIY